MAKRTPLSDALSHAAHGQPAQVPAEARPSPRAGQSAKSSGASPDKAKAYRVGRVNITGYFDPAVKQSIRLIQAKHRPESTVQDLLAEALDDLFAKYNVPQTAKVKD